MYRLFLAVLIVFVSLNSGHAVTHALSGPLDPAQATTNPDDIGNGTGMISGDYDDVSNTLNYSIEWMDLTSDVTNMHFHLGSTGVAGGVQLGIPGPWSSPEIGTAIVLSDTNETDLLAGNWYVNVHTANFGGGEIRGQVNVTQVPEPNGVGLAIIAFLSTCSFVRRKLRD